MPKVTILPLDRVIEAEDGATIMDAAHEHGLYWPTTCGGQGICTSCACTIEDGEANLEPMGRGELRTMAEEMGEATVRARKLRLACQTRVRGDVTVTKRGVRPQEDELLTANS
jgi:ferredoxin, 2Fe-2S